MNNVQLIGNLTKDSELRYTTSNKPIVTFTIAVNEGYGDNKKTQYFNIVSFGAEKLCQYLIKGIKVAINGKLSNSSYEKDGVKHYKTEILANNYGGIEIVSNKNTNKQEAVGTYGDNAFGIGDITPVDSDDTMPF